MDGPIKTQKLPCAQISIITWVFGKIAHLAPGFRFLDVDPHYGRPARGGSDEIAENLYGGALTRTIGPDKAEDLTIGHTQAQILHRHDLLLPQSLPVNFAKLLNCYGRHGISPQRQAYWWF